jgi:Asp/Glu/hydantoin racemase
MADTTRALVLVINPNSNENVTERMAEALLPMANPDGPDISCVTLSEGPFGIECQADADSVIMPMRRLVEARTDAAAYVIACYSDPGLQTCREATTKPVFGIAECGLLSALARGERFGVIAVSSRAIPRHMRYLRQLGLESRFAGERAAEITVAQAASADDAFERMLRAGQALKEEDGANVLILGCAGMARHRAPLEARLGIPVIDPTQAAVAIAVGTVQIAAAAARDSHRSDLIQSAE